MATPKEQLQNKLNCLSNFEVIETLDFIDFLEQKRTKEIMEVLKNAPEEDEPLTEEELQAVKEAREDIKTGNTLTYEDVFCKDE